MSATVDEAVKQLKRMVEDPDTYFRRARQVSEAVVRDEMAKEKQARSRRPKSGR